MHRAHTPPPSEVRPMAVLYPRMPGYHWLSTSLFFSSKSRTVSPSLEKLIPVWDPVNVKNPWGAMNTLAFGINVVTVPTEFWSFHRSRDTGSDSVL